MTITGVIAWLIVGGAIGGIADLFFHIRYERYQNDGKKGGFTYKAPTAESGPGIPLKFSGFISLCFLNSFIGLAGAVGLQVILIGIGKFSAVQSVENNLLLLSLSVIAGFGARRLLPQIRDRLEEEILKTKEESREAAEDTRTQLKVLASLRPEAPASERSLCIAYLTKELRSNPIERTNAITLGRLHRASGDLGSAVATLTRFLEAKGDVRDKDYADALYNRACYNSLLWRREQREELLTSIFSDLTLSFQLSPENRKDAETDDDFKHLRENSEISSKFSELY